MSELMTNNSILIFIGLVLILGTGGLVYWQKNAAFEAVTPSENSETVTPNSSDSANNSDDDDGNEVEDEDEDFAAPTPKNTAPSGASYTMAQVAVHNSGTSCWSAINGNIYDLTSWIPKHPGGSQAILQLCGTDGSAEFNGQHGGDSKPTSVLAGFRIGVLAN